MGFLQHYWVFRQPAGVLVLLANTLGLLHFCRAADYGNFDDRQRSSLGCHFQHLHHLRLLNSEQWDSSVKSPASFPPARLTSGCSRSIKGLQDWLFYLTYATQSRYAAAFLNRQVFLYGDLSKPLPFDQQHNCTNMNQIETSLLNGITNPYCR